MKFRVTSFLQICSTCILQYEEFILINGFGFVYISFVEFSTFYSFSLNFSIKPDFTILESNIYYKSLFPFLSYYFFMAMFLEISSYTTKYSFDLFLICITITNFFFFNMRCYTFNFLIS